jgi:tetratricopeptide (TPR) repeat protein
LGGIKMGFWKDLIDGFGAYDDLRLVNDPNAPTFDRMEARRRLAVGTDLAARADAERQAEFIAELTRVRNRVAGRLKAREYDQAVQQADLLLPLLEAANRAGWREPAGRLADALLIRGHAYWCRASQQPPSLRATAGAADLAAAERAYEEAARLVPDKSEPLTQLGLIHLFREHYPQATSTFTRAIDVDPSDFWARVYLGLVRIEVGDCEAGVKTLEAAWAIDPENGDTQRAVETWKSAVEVLVKNGNEKYSQDEFAPAAALFTRALARPHALPAGQQLLSKDERADVLLKRAAASREVDGPDAIERGIADCRAAIRLTPRNKRAFLQLARFHEELRTPTDKGGTKEALRCYKRVLVLDPKDAEAQENLVDHYYGRAEKWLDRHKYDKAIRYIKKSFEYRKPECGQGDPRLKDLGYAYLLTGELREAGRVAKRLIESADERHGYLLRGDVYWAREEFQKAAEDYARYIECCHDREFAVEEFDRPFFWVEISELSSVQGTPASSLSPLQRLCRPGAYQEQVALDVQGQAPEKVVDQFLAAWASFAKFEVTLPVTRRFQAIARQVELIVPETVTRDVIELWLDDPLEFRNLLTQRVVLAVPGVAEMMARKLAVVRATFNDDTWELV